jgi:hypothetical protein
MSVKLLPATLHPNSLGKDGTGFCPCCGKRKTDPDHVTLWNFLVVVHDAQYIAQTKGRRSPLELVDLPLNICVNAKGSSTTFNLIHQNLKLDGNGGRPNVDSMLALVKHLDFLNVLIYRELQEFLNTCALYQMVVEILTTKNPVPHLPVELTDLLAVMVDSGPILDRMIADKDVILPSKWAKVNLRVPAMGVPVHITGNLSNPLSFPSLLPRVPEQEKTFAFWTWRDFLKPFAEQDQRVLFVCILDLVTNNRLHLNLLWHVHQKLNEGT